jgi:cobalt-zinc-cadmium efflux system membrane fusion protein
MLAPDYEPHHTSPRRILKRSNLMKPKSILTAGVALFVAGGLALLQPGCAREEDHGEERETETAERGSTPDRIELSPKALETLDLTYEVVGERELSPSLEVPAELMAVPDRRATVGPRVAGRVVAVRVNSGDEVGRGDPLVLLESEAVGRARADFIAAEARFDVARRAAERTRGLLEDRIASQRAVEEAEGALQVAAADLQAAETRLATFGVSAEAVHEDDPAQVVLKSPLSGVVVARSANVGAWVEPSDTLVEVAQLEELWLEASVYEREVQLVQPGQSVEVEVRAYPGERFQGTVGTVAAVLEERTRSATVRVVLPNPEKRLKPGMFATARIQGAHTHEPRPMLAIPSAAVQEVDDHYSVFVRLAEAQFELRPVHTGDRAGEYVEVLNGLTAGEEVVVEGSFLLKGQLLRASLGEDE